MNEQFSAFLDNEATRDEADSVLNALLRDETLRESWGRQHWLRETLRAHRGEPAVGVDSGFSKRVMQAIAADNGAGIDGSRADKVVPLRVAESGKRRHRWRNMGAGLAVAASAAGMAFLVTGGSLTRDEVTGERPTSATVASADAAQGRAVEVKTSRDVANTSGDATRMMASNTMAGATIQSVSSQQSTTADRGRSSMEGPADHWSVSDPALEEELNSYLVEHNGLARGYGLSGTTPAFVRVATYGQEPAQ